MHQVTTYIATNSLSKNNILFIFSILGNVYIADTYNHRIRKITVSTGFITSIAGSGSTGSASGSFSGDNGQATSAKLNKPYGVTLDSAGKWLTPCIAMLYVYSAAA
jgi:hypothetical protein